MREKQDYKAWYYIPVPKEPAEMKQKYIENHGHHGYDIKNTKQTIKRIILLTQTNN